METSQNQIFLQALKSLGDNVRFDIVLLLASGSKCVCDIYEKLELKQSIVSHHLGVLREIGLVEMERDGKWIYYSLNKKKLLELQKFIDKLITGKQKNNKCKQKICLKRKI